jgi:hypothetical protein
MEEWRDIEGFSGYSVSNRGRVRNDETGHILALQVNQEDIMYVGMTIDKKQYKRAVTPLVARAFLPEPRNRHFNTPIHLDGDRWNNDVENLMWRPRWFAVAYQKQFRTHIRGFVIPIEDIKTGEVFPTSWDAATKYGLIDEEIRVATLNRTYVWPTYQEFRVLS